MSQISLLLGLYVRPLKTFSRVLDEGRLIFAALAAVAVLLVLQVPRAIEHQREEYKARMRAIQARAKQAAAKAEARGSSTPEQIESDLDMEDYFADMMAPVTGPPALRAAMDRFTLQNPTQYFSPLIAMAVCFVPIAILVLTLWDNLGGFATILFRDYMALLVCCLLAWTAP